MTAIVLDTGGLEAWSRRRPPPDVLALMEVLRRVGSARVVVPSVVAVEALTGAARDAAIDRVLRGVQVEDHLPISTCRTAATLRQGTSASAVDAVVAEAASRHRAAAVVTSDPGDLAALLDRASSGVEVVAV